MNVQSLEKEVERLHEELRQKDTETANIIREHRLQLEHLHDSNVIKVLSFFSSIFICFFV